MEHDILNEQIAYYRARAREYDESVGETGEPKGVFARAMHLLEEMGPFEQVLELACGTGIWTRALLQVGRDITAIAELAICSATLSALRRSATACRSASPGFTHDYIP